MQIGFMCPHPMYLPHARLLIHTIHENGGFLSDSDIRVMVPEIYYDEVKKGLSVTCDHFRLPEWAKGIPFFDKIYAASLWEESLQGAGLWMDVDSMVIREPKSLQLVEKGRIGVMAVDGKNIGQPYGTPISGIWKDLMAYTQIEQSHEYVLTRSRKEKLFPYYNAGMIYMTRQEEIFRRTWRLIQETVTGEAWSGLYMKEPLTRIFYHQAALSIILMRDYPKQLDHLALTMNYPIHMEHEMIEKSEMSCIETIRYDTYFSKNHDDIQWASYLLEPQESYQLPWIYE